MATLPQNDLFGDDHACFCSFDLCVEDGEDQLMNRINGPSHQRNFQQNAEINKMKATEDFLAADFTTLSAKERSEALDDVHCVGEELQETPEKIQESLAEFHRLAQTRRDPIYEYAVNQNRAYVEDPSFRLMFLRRNAYDVCKSVNQMINLLEQKALYFGNDKVAREITLGDLNEDDQGCLRCMCHIQDGRDQMGRVIVYWFPKELRKHHQRAETTIRALYYFAFNILLRIPGVQTKGIVSVIYDTKVPDDQVARMGTHFLLVITNFTGLLPFRITSSHCCLEPSVGSSAIFSAFMGILARTLPKHTRARIRIHYGSHVELTYGLRGYGIPTYTFPIDVNGKIRDDLKHRWFYDHLLTVQQPPVRPASNDQRALNVLAGAAREFSDKDILLGRGRFVQFHPGNVQFRQFLESHMGEYERVDRPTKRQIATNLVRAILSSGARILQSNDKNGWIENDFDDSVNKVAQFYRTKRRAIKKGL